MSNSIDLLAAGRNLAADNTVVDGAAGIARPAASQNAVSAGKDDKDANAGAGRLAGAMQRSRLQGRIDEINRQLQMKAVSVQFQIEPGYKDVILKVVDQQDGKVVLQIPSEEVVRIARVMDQLKGVLLEKTA
jgi:flagellar protein FlaG